MLPASQRMMLYSTILLRRVKFRPWFWLIARVGETGVDEYFLDPYKIPLGDNTVQVYKARFVASRSGELFFYVNNAVAAIPWVTPRLYAKNSGTAKITVRLM
jgi:hypothetical protein